MLVGCTALRPGTERPDAGLNDAGLDDAGLDDAGSDDAGSGDAGSDDAGSDGGPDLDSGVDAGPLPCLPFDERAIVRVERVIDSATHWTCRETIELRGVVLVQDVLRIDPGVVVRGMNEAARLVVSSTGRLDAIGTADEPIRFTGTEPVPGSWGGVVLLGLAPLGPGANTSIMVGPEVPGARFGGIAGAHNCGTLEFVSIDYAAQDPDTEGTAQQDDRLDNALTLAGCGTATRVSDVRIAHPEDDGLVLLGGAPVIRRVYLYQTPDEGVEWDLGFTGTVQFVVVHHAVEGDDAVRSSHSQADTNKGDPTFANLTLFHVDPDGDDVLSIEDDTTGTFMNAVGVGFDEDAVDVVAESGVSDPPDVRNSLFFNTTARHFFETGDSPDANDDVGFDEEAVYSAPSTDNCFGLDPMLNGSGRTYTITTPAGCTSVDPRTVDPRLETADFLGAIPPGEDSWITPMVLWPDS
ncbi:MAG: hypothetical protein AB8I08_09970 [Sandaracinaceae bacterium]